jgi:pyruvate dehydrogenase E2 component (dihydrolipoamide acetyltransferase)
MRKGLLLQLGAPAVAALLLAGEVRAADPPAPAPAKDAPAAPAKDAPAAPPKDAAGPAPGAKSADGKPSPLHFEPTEKTRADFEVSFPTDI